MPVYLDHAATSPMRPAVWEAYSQALLSVGNPSSVHKFGQESRNLLESARESIASAIGANRSEIIFTSGGTESNNLAIKGLFWNRNSIDSNRNIILTAGTEHHAALDPSYWLEDNQGAKVQLVPVDERGVLDLDWLETYLKEFNESVALGSFMWANNETGVISDIPTISRMLAKYGIPAHSDAVAAFGHIPIDFEASQLATLAVSAHKLGGPVGVGALLVGRSVKLASLVHGGGQERGMRSGTMNSAGVTAFAAAVAETLANQPEEELRLARLSQLLIDGILEIVPEAQLSRGSAPGLSSNVHFTFPGCSADSLIFLLDAAGFSVSAGSACTAGVNRPSHVLLAMGRSEDEATGAMRVTLGYTSTEADIEGFLKAFPAAHESAKRAGLPSK